MVLQTLHAQDATVDCACALQLPRSMHAEPRPGSPGNTQHNQQQWRSNCHHPAPHACCSCLSAEGASCAAVLVQVSSSDMLSSHWAQAAGRVLSGCPQSTPTRPCVCSQDVPYCTCSLYLAFTAHVMCCTRVCYQGRCKREHAQHGVQHQAQVDPDMLVMAGHTDAWIQLVQAEWGGPGIAVASQEEVVWATACPGPATLLAS
jgi:hypothetical protein